MEKILIVGAGTFQRPLIEYASKCYDVLVAAPSIEYSFTPYIYDKLLIDVRDKEAILEFARNNKISGVITDQTDIAVRTVAYVAEKMGLPGIGYQTGCLFTDKSLMRSRMVELGINVLPNKTVSSLEEAIDFYDSIDESVIIKPLDTQGSRGVYLCSDKKDIINKFNKCKEFSSNGLIIIEKCAKGREFVVEGIALNGEFRNLNCGDTEYFDIPDAFAAKTRIFPSTANEELVERIYDLNTRIITGFGLKQGITHSEFIMDGDEIYLIETAARGGGVFISSDLIHLSTGLNTEKFLVEIATGELNSLPETQVNNRACGYMAFYVPDGVVTEISGLDSVINADFVHRNQLNELFVGKVFRGGQKDKTSRLAIIVSGQTLDELHDNMCFIRNTLKVSVDSSGEKRQLIWG